MLKLLGLKCRDICDSLLKSEKSVCVCRKRVRDRQINVGKC